MKKRGIPDYEKSKTEVHLILPDDHNVLCYNGSWHVFYTSDKSEVTCERCLEKLNKRSRWI